MTHRFCHAADFDKLLTLEQHKVAVILALVMLMAVSGVQFRLERSPDDFGLRSHGVVETVGGRRTKFYPLPQSTASQYFRLRREDLRVNPFPPGQYQCKEVIGPHQTDQTRIWFGNNYYDAEGMRGVGAFGYFDTETRRYEMFSPPAVARYQISALLVETEDVWLALDHFGEDTGGQSGGVVQWNRITHETHSFPFEAIVSRIVRQGPVLRLTTRDGYAFIRDAHIQRFLNNGRPIRKFPLPPSHY